MNEKQLWINDPMELLPFRIGDTFEQDGIKAKITKINDLDISFDKRDDTKQGELLQELRFAHYEPKNKQLHIIKRGKT